MQHLEEQLQEASRRADDERNQLMKCQAKLEEREREQETEALDRMLLSITNQNIVNNKGAYRHFYH